MIDEYMLEVSCAKAAFEKGKASNQKATTNVYASSRNCHNNYDIVD